MRGYRARSTAACSPQAGDGVVARAGQLRAEADAALHSGLRALLVQRRRPGCGGGKPAAEAHNRAVRLTRAHELRHRPGTHNGGEDAQRAAEMPAGEQKPSVKRRRAAGFRDLQPEYLGGGWPVAVRHTARHRPEQRVGEEQVRGELDHVSVADRKGSCCCLHPRAQHLRHGSLHGRRGLHDEHDRRRAKAELLEQGEQGGCEECRQAVHHRRWSAIGDGFVGQRVGRRCRAAGWVEKRNVLSVLNEIQLPFLGS